MKKRLLMIICLLTELAANIHAASHWSINPYGFQYDMTAYITLTLNNKAVNNLADYEIAAFCGTECRGVATIQSSEKDGQTTIYGYLRIRSNQQSEETIIFKVYDTRNDKEFIVDGITVSFQALDVVGLPSNPLQLNIVYVPKGDVNEDGVVDIADAAAVLNIMAGYNTGNGDVNEDGVVNIADVAAVLNIMASR